MDMFYRYKRDKLVLKKVGEFYVLDNIEAVIKSLNLKVDLFLKEIQPKIGGKVICDKATKKYKIKSNCDIDSLLESYIKNTILCEKCILPEYCCDTNICKACGYKKKLKK